MAEHDFKKAERLVSFRKLERERASRELASAGTAVRTAENAIAAQENLIALEVSNLSGEKGERSRPEEMHLALACVEAARLELKQKEELLKKAEESFGQKSQKLLLIHKKVRQMETLQTAARAALKKASKQKENREIDDLAVNREARK
jgi:hypothetical protein